MNRRARVLVGGVGLLGLAGALALAAVPEMADGIGAAIAGMVETDYFLAVGVAAVALAVVVAVLALRGIGGIDQATPPEPETVQNAPHPGSRFDDAVGRTSWLSFGGDRDRRRAVRERVRRAAVQSVVHREGISRERARERVESGSWTDDDAAAAFLRERERERPTGRLLRVFSPRSRFDRGARRAVDELWRREEGERR